MVVGELASSFDLNSSCQGFSQVERRLRVILKQVVGSAFHLTSSSSEAFSGEGDVTRLPRMFLLRISSVPECRAPLLLKLSRHVDNGEVC